MGRIYIKPVQPSALGSSGSSGAVISLVRTSLSGLSSVISKEVLQVETDCTAGLRSIIDRLLPIIKTAGVPAVNPKYLPLRMIYSAEGPPGADTWLIAPMGGILVPSSCAIPGAGPWLYQWEILPVGRGTAINRLIFPFRSLLIQGDSPHECFFCGSRSHTERDCQAVWDNPPASTAEGLPSRPLLSAMAAFAPGHWAELLKRAGRKEMSATKKVSGQRGHSAGLDTAFSQLLQEMRADFAPQFAAKICLSGALDFSELGCAPEREIKKGAIKEAAEALAAGSPELCAEILSRLDEESQGAEFYIMKGFSLMAKSSREKALASWLEAESRARTPLRRAYSALLLSRLFFVRGEMRSAGEAAQRAVDADKGCLEAHYWRLAAAASMGRCSGIEALFQKMTSSPELLVSAMADPVFIACQEAVENGFKRCWMQTEEELKSKVSSLEKALEAAKDALGHVAVADVDKKFMEWRGRWADMGLAQLYRGAGFLEDLWAEISEIIRTEAEDTVQRLAAAAERLRNMVSALPASSQGRSLKMRCADLLRRTGRLLHKKAPPGITKAADHVKQMRQLLAEYRALEAECQEFFRKRLRNRLIAKCAAGGLLVMLIMWIFIYLYLNS